MLLKLALVGYASLPSRERGLKFSCFCIPPKTSAVAPLAGAWIEISESAASGTGSSVAPLAGAWIEILYEMAEYLQVTSLPSRERGLKCFYGYNISHIAQVAPLAGAWIEI